MPLLLPPLPLPAFAIAGDASVGVSLTEVPKDSALLVCFPSPLPVVGGVWASKLCAAGAAATSALRRKRGRMGGGGVAPTLAGLVWDEANVGEPLYDDGVGGKEDGDEEEEEEVPPPPAAPAPATAAAEVGRAGEQRDVAEGLVGRRAAAEDGDVPVIDARNEATTDGEGEEQEEEEEEGTAEDDGAEGVPGARGGGEEEANEASGEEEARVVERAEVAEEDEEEEEDWRVRRRASRRERRRAVCASSFGRVE